MQPGLCKVKEPWDVPEQKSNSFSIIWLTTVLHTVSCHQSSGAGWGTHHFIVVCCYSILFLYALKKRTWRVSCDFLKVSLGCWQTMEKQFYFASWLSADDLPQWQESKFGTFVEALHRVFWCLLRLEQRRQEVRNIWVSFQSWNYLSGWCIRVESTGSLGKHCIWVQLHITSSSTWLAREQELQECFW